LQVDWTQVRDDLIGDAVVLAYRNAKPGVADSERGVFLTWMKDPQLARRLFQRLDQVQKESGELASVQTPSHLGINYLRRVKSNGASEYVLLHDRIGAFSPQETAIKQVIERIKQSTSVNDSLVREFDALKLRDATAAIWINPRNFDADLNARLSQAPAEEAAFLGTFSKFWKGLRGAALKFSLDRTAELSLTLATDPNAMPRAITRLARGLGTRSRLLDFAPSNAMVYAGGSIDVAAFLETLSSLMTPEAWKRQSEPLQANFAQIMGKKYAGRLAEHLGPEIAFFIVPPADKLHAIPSAVLIVQVRSAQDRHFEPALRDAAESLVALVRVHFNSKFDEPVRLETIRNGRDEIRSLVHDRAFPTGWSPAYTIRDGFLIIATHPRLIVDLKRDSGPTSGADRPAVLARISSRKLADYLVAHKDALVAHFKSADGGNVADIENQVGRLLMFIELFEQGELIASSDSTGEWKLTLRVSGVESMSKK
jgi:plasmid stabilization system protein ParE